MIRWSIVPARRYLVMLSTYLFFFISFFMFLLLVFIFSFIFIQHSVLHRIQNGWEEGEDLVLGIDCIEVLQRNRCFFFAILFFLFRLLNRLSLLEIIKMYRHWMSLAPEALNYIIIISIIIDDTTLYLCFWPRFSWPGFGFVSLKCSPGNYLSWLLGATVPV